MIIKRISCVLKISDGSSKKVLAGSQVQLFVDGILVKHEYRQGGYFVLLGLDEGRHLLKICSFCFQTEEIEIFVDNNTTATAESMVRYIILNPSERHPNVASMPSVRGSVEGYDRIYILRHGGELKVAEDNAAEGKTAIKLFCGGSKPALPSVYRISDKAADKCEFVTLKGADGEMYLLDKPLRFSHPRSSVVVPLVSVSCGADGAFFFMLSSEFKRDEDGTIPLTILATKGDVLYTARATATSKGITELGEINLKKG